MFISKTLKFAALPAVLLLCSCAVSDSGKDVSGSSEDLVFTANPEPLKGKQDVYSSIARTVKYNVDAASHNLRKKIPSREAAPESDALIKKVVNANVNDENKLATASRVLDFSVIYATVALSGSQPYVDNYFYESSSRHLALAAVRAHQDAWFAGKKIKQINRLERQEKKIVENLNAKEKRNGTLSPAEYDYRKNQEVLLLKLSELRENLEFMLVEYGQLAKADLQKVDLEGRRFYELEDFDKDYQIEIFQEAAVRNRKEFALAKEKVKSYAFSDVRRDISNRYPPVSHLDVNGLKVENDVYENELYDKAILIAANLLDAIGNLRQAKPGSDTYSVLQEKAFDELGAAILTQSEVSYQLVKLADADYETAERAQNSLKKEIRRLEKIYRPDADDKLALFNAKINMFELERRMAQIKAERAVALRSLYFNAGLSPFDKRLLKAPVQDIAQMLRQSFNRDLIEMMSAAKVQMNVLPQAPEERGWAQKPNWLEEAVAAPVRKRPAVPVRTAAAGAAKPTVMQLGAYEDRNNATVDWNEISARLPALKAYTPQIEPAVINGQQWHRLVIRGESAALVENCRRVQAAGFDCLLR